MKILYIMHVSWGWAKQRPHFLAEELSQSFQLLVCCKTMYRRSQIANNESHVKITELRILPMSRIKPIGVINDWLIRLQIKKMLAKHDIIWFTNPQLYEKTQDLISVNKIVVYDCMDDVMEFPIIKNSQQNTLNIFRKEATLLSRANLVLCTSWHLIGKLKQRYTSFGGEIHLVNNALNIEAILQNRVEYTSFLKERNKVNLVYIGTISTWMDWDLILKSLEEEPTFTYHFFGPCEYQPPQHPRMLFYGSINHSKVASVMAEADILLMPFVVNDLILSVNPVKLYEYILAQKPAVAVRYPETEQFSDFVWLYSNYYQYMNHIRNCITNNYQAKNTAENAQKFAKENTWQARANTITTLLKQLY